MSLLVQTIRLAEGHPSDPLGQGAAVGFIDSSSGKMVMLHADTGKFWSAYRIGDNYFSNIVDKGFLW